jgi:ankyrin repeat protein
VSENRTDIVMVLLDKGASTDQKDTWGRTPLSDALSNQRVDIAAALMGKGVDQSFSHNVSKVPERAGVPEFVMKSCYLV